MLAVKTPVGNQPLIIGAAVYLLCFLFYYPHIFAINDESTYFSMAYVLRQGTLFIDQTNIPVSEVVHRGGHTVPFYSLGMSSL